MPKRLLYITVRKAGIRVRPNRYFWF